MTTALDRRRATGGVRTRGPFQRVPQFCRAVVTRQNLAVDARIRDLLENDEQWALLERLVAYDRAHHLRVHDMLVHNGYADPDLLRAALLHDVGKADGRGKVRVGHRVAVVLLRRVAPRLLARLNHADLPWPLHGLYLGEYHAQLGAVLAEQAGATRRTCELIARHERRGHSDDTLLLALIVADDWTIA